MVLPKKFNPQESNPEQNQNTEDENSNKTKIRIRIKYIFKVTLPE
jgi:hypothetical protein